MKEPISGETIFEYFIKEIEWNQGTVAVKNSYTPTEIVSMAYTNIQKCGLYQDDCREWSQKPRLKETWNIFNTHFERAFKETQKSSRTSKTKGFASNVKSTQANEAFFTKMQQDHTMNLENLAKVIQADRTSIAMLTKTIAEISTQVSTLTAKLVTAQSENACLKRFGHPSSPADHEHCLDNVQTPSDKNPLRDCNIYSTIAQKFDPNRYLSSHGFKVEESCTSATCCYPVDGHNILATRLDTKGGKTWNKNWIFDGPTE